ncbi:VOC family protein [Rhizobium leguminosarum]|nr:VOC family protein [Rhizobium leguminosarum]AVC48232.1 glyoxalase-like domain protein [Rhizobium leguminosarum bv. viciae]MBA9031297.1 phospholipase/carboxylesterase [Rhizobium leguminosarum]MBB4330276.1 phospholipase/carboxylesterase [Rhizobium leguminosarum]MBB4343725.1 phospholipase/carboxylesterase [Rhizobium leguminosarum]MBB4356266.1 phospholipase/carboxylesterase [Rhizobium leguminosarum]
MTFAALILALLTTPLQSGLLSMVSGIHHVTAVTRKVQANVDFYAGFLGMRLVKQTAGYEDATQLHLFYGDAAGTPGSLLTFLAWEDGAPGRAGYGQISEISLSIDPASIGYWLTRAMSFGLRSEGPADEFGEPVLRLKDPDNIILKLAGAKNLVSPAAWDGASIPAEHAIQRVRGATMLTEKPAESRNFLESHFGYRFQASRGTIDRLVSQSGDIIDVRDARGFWSGAPGTGTVDHVAFRAADEETLLSVRKALEATDASPTNMHDRKYFRSLYAREPGGTLVELATDKPGMTVDEEHAALGGKLFAPPEAITNLHDLKVMLPQFSMPGQPRINYRELPFVHRFYTPPDPDGSVFVLLHGSGGNETTLMPLLNKAAPRATLLGVRGRATEEGFPRWYKRITPFSFDQNDIKTEAEAFAAFIEGAVKSYGLDPQKVVYVGYSNGANLLNSLLYLHPNLVHKAVLLRSMPVLSDYPHADLKGTDLLVISGKTDAYGKYASELEERLKSSGATVDSDVIPGGHDLGDADIPIIQKWLLQENR